MDGEHTWFDVASPSLTRNVEAREDSTICLQICHLFLVSWPMLCLRFTDSANLLVDTVTQGLVGCTCQPVLLKFTEMTLTDLFHCVYCSYRTFVHDDICVYSIPWLQAMGFPCPQMLPTWSILSYSLFVPICFTLFANVFLNFASLVISTMEILFKFKMATRYHVGSNW